MTDLLLITLLGVTIISDTAIIYMLSKIQWGVHNTPLLTKMLFKVTEDIDE